MSAKKRPKRRLFILMLTFLFLFLQVPSQTIEAIMDMTDEDWTVSDLNVSYAPDTFDTFYDTWQPIYIEYGCSDPEGWAMPDEEVVIWGDETMIPVYDPDWYGYYFETWMTPFDEDYNLELLDDPTSECTTFIMPPYPVTFIAHYVHVERPGEPIITDVVSIDYDLTVYWDPPYYGAEPVEYRISLDGEMYDFLPGDACSYVFSGLEGGRTYQIDLFAVAEGGVEGAVASTSAMVEPIPVIEPVPNEIIDVDLNIDGPIWKKMLREDLKVNPHLINRFGNMFDDEDDDEVINIIGDEALDRINLLLQHSNWRRFITPWLVGELRLKYLREHGTPRDVTLQLAHRVTGDIIRGGGDLYLSTECEDGTYSAELFPNDAEHNPIVRELQPGVRYRFGQLLPTPDGFSIPDDYLFYIDDDGQVWDAVTHTKHYTLRDKILGDMDSYVRELNVVTLETEQGLNVICSVRSTEEPDKELVGVSLEIRFPSDYNQIPASHGATYWFSEEEPMTTAINADWEECTFALNEEMPGYKTPEPSIFRAGQDVKPYSYS